jgi:hypothetical protein
MKLGYERVCSKGSLLGLLKVQTKGIHLAWSRKAVEWALYLYLRRVVVKDEMKASWLDSLTKDDDLGLYLD